MLIDSFAPKFDATEIHQMVINAPAANVYRALWNADLGASLIIKLLLLMRSLPQLISNRSRLPPRNQKVTLQTLIDSGFGILAENPGREIVLGVAGRFWRPTGNLSPFARRDFDEEVRPGLARAVWNFNVSEDIAGRQTILTTETRVICADDSSRRKFRAYWLFVRPFSGLIRRIMLKSVSKAAVSYNPPARGD